VTRVLAAAAALTLAGVTALIALTGGDPASALRHAYLIPVVALALAFGGPGGGLGAGATLVLYAPIVLVETERSGLTPETIEGLVTFAVVAGVGVLGGALTARARRQRARCETLVAIQRALAGTTPLEAALGRLRAVLVERLRVDDVGLVVRDGEGLVIAGADRVAAGSAAASVLAVGSSVFVPDAGGGARPRRVVVAPLVVAGEPIGALAVERVGELGGDERAALEALGAHVAVVLEHARLTSRQRRFAEELERSVAGATRHLEELDRAKSAFVAIASHELRTPLTALQGFSEILAARPHASDEVARIAGIMRGEAARLGRIVSDLLDLSRIERGLAPTLHRAPVAVEAALAATADLFRRGAKGTIVVDCAPALPPMDADRDALERILANLVSNAVKYSPPGSEVRLGARRAGAMVEVEVLDRGVGIAETALARIFEPYYRAAETSTVRGTGLGLAVVKALVEAHGGAIHVESARGAGTRVTFSVPAVP
jgi:two-component system sensor histidine kinase KdpD